MQNDDFTHALRSNIRHQADNNPLLPVNKMTSVAKHLLVFLLALVSCAWGSLPAVIERTGTIHTHLRDSQAHHAGANMKTIDAVRVDRHGDASRIQVMKQQLASELQLPLRDLRLIDPSFPSQIQAAFAARPHAILFTLENIKVVVKSDEALVFGSTDQKEMLEFVPALQLQINSILCAASAPLSCKPGSRSMRFEHVVIEAALNVVCSNLLRQVRALAPAISLALQSLQAESRGLDIIKTQADQLLPLKNQLDELRKRTKEIDRAIKEVLDNDEDMLMMHLGLQNEAVQAYSAEETAHAPSVTESLWDTLAAAEPQHTHEHGEIAVDEETPARRDITQPWRRHRGYIHRMMPHSRLPNRTHTTKGSLSVPRHVQEDATISLEMMLENYLHEIGWIASEVHILRSCSNQNRWHW